MEKRNLVNRAYKKLARIPFLQKPLLLGEDLSQSTIFRLNSLRRQAHYENYKNCKTLEDKFNFSANIFGPHQIKNEIISFLEFSKNAQPRNVCEIGTADGGTSFLLSQALPSVELMIGIDLYVKNKAKLQYFSKTSQEICFIDGSSYDHFTINKVKQILSGRQLDLLFIDGDHSYEGVREDFLNYKDLVQENGIIAFHDVVPDYLTRFGKHTGRWAGDVHRLWSKLKPLYPSFEFVEDPNQDGLGIGAIRYSKVVPLPESL